MDLNREFARLVGLCWHEYDTETLNCIHCEKVMWRKDSNNPDYAADPRLALREMVKRKDWPEFRHKIGTVMRIIKDKPAILVNIDYILDTTGLLRNKAIEFLKEKENEST